MFNSRRKTTTLTPEDIRTRVLSNLTTYLMRHGVGFETLPDGKLAIHTSPGQKPVLVQASAYYGDETGTFILVRTINSIQDGIEHTHVSGERSATQRLYNLAHDIVKSWDSYLEGIQR